MNFSIIFKILFLTNCSSAFLTGDYRYCNNTISSRNYLSDTMRIFGKYFNVPDWAKNQFRLADCQRRGYDFVPTDHIRKDVEILDLSFNRIRRITATNFFGLNDLVVIFLGLNCLPPNILTPLPGCDTDLYIVPGSFNNLLKLRFLSLKGNYLRGFPKELPYSLLYLDIAATYLGNITKELQENAPNLKALTANENCMYNDYCPRNFTISSNFSSSLQYVDLSYNAWTKIPRYLLSSETEALILTSNVVSRIHKDDFVNARNLKVLLLSWIFYRSNPNMTIEEGAFDPLINLEILDLSWNWMEYIPEHLFRYNTKLKSLDLSMNSLAETIYNPTYLEHLHFLQYLDVSANVGFDPTQHHRLLNLGSSYSNLTSLESLMIGFSPITAPELAYFKVSQSDQFDAISNTSLTILSSLKNLTTLSISGISLKTLNSSLWMALPNLKSLYASYNNISNKKVPYNSLETIQNYFDHRPGTHLQRINKFPSHSNHSYQIKTLQITDVPLHYKCSNNDGILDLSHNHITDLSDNFVALLIEACRVDLSHNRIMFIHEDDFINFSNLQELILDYNRLSKIDANAFFSLDNLKVLRMFFVNMDVNNEALDFLTRLPQTVNVTLIWNEQLEAVFDTLFILQQSQKHIWFDSIVSLDLSGNTMYNPKQIFYLLQNFRNLESLTLRHCYLLNVMISLSFFTVEGSLKYLDLGENKLNQLPKNQALNLKKLEILKLDHNFISALEDDFLSLLVSLKEFIISHNKISYIEPGFFLHSNLKHLDVAYNFITRLGVDILPLSFLNSLDYLDIRGNIFDCSCEVWETFYLWVISPQTKHVHIPGYQPQCIAGIDYEGYEGCVSCQSPYQLRGYSLLSFSANSHCEFTCVVGYTVSFSVFFFLFTIFGTIGSSKWVKRLVFRKVNEKFRVHSLKQRGQRSNYDQRVRKAFLFFDLNYNEVGDWVDDRLSNAMKNGNPSIPLTIVGKDDSCGVAPSQQVLRRIMNSQKTIIILTNDFCFKPECRFLISALQELRYSKGDDHVVLIAWSGVDGAPLVPREIQETFNRKKQYFLRFDVTNDDETMFFETLRTVLVNQLVPEEDDFVVRNAFP